MSDYSWAAVLDAAYEQGGYGAIPVNDSADLDPDLDLTLQTDRDREEVISAARKLDSRDLANFMQLNAAGSGTAHSLQLTQDGFRLAHDRLESKRTHKSNQAISLLTMVLAAVGIAQAVALTAQVSDVVGGLHATLATIAAFSILLTIFIGLSLRGMLDFEAPPA